MSNYFYNIVKMKKRAVIISGSDPRLKCSGRPVRLVTGGRCLPAPLRSLRGREWRGRSTSPLVQSAARGIFRGNRRSRRGRGGEGGGETLVSDDVFVDLCSSISPSLLLRSYLRVFVCIRNLDALDLGGNPYHSIKQVKQVPMRHRCRVGAPG